MPVAAAFPHSNSAIQIAIQWLPTGISPVIHPIPIGLSSTTRVLNATADMHEEKSLAPELDEMTS